MSGTLNFIISLLVLIFMMIITAILVILNDIDNFLKWLDKRIKKGRNKKVHKGGRYYDVQS